jgi:probable rRNA maturation factor
MLSIFVWWRRHLAGCPESILLSVAATSIESAPMFILDKPVGGENELSLARFLARAKRAVGLRGAVTVLVTTSRELQTLNRRFRHKDAPTDVLSFPSDMVATQPFAGDVAISADIAARNARRFGHSTADEVKILTLHGLLHLAGYDHESDHGRMARREQLLRKKLHLPVALIERSRMEDSNSGRGPATRRAHSIPKNRSRSSAPRRGLR